MVKKQRIVIVALFVILTLFSMLPVVWAMPNSQGTVPTRTPTSKPATNTLPPPPTTQPPPPPPPTDTPEPPTVTPSATSTKAVPTLTPTSTKEVGGITVSPTVTPTHTPTSTLPITVTEILPTFTPTPTLTLAVTQTPSPESLAAEVTKPAPSATHTSTPMATQVMPGAEPPSAIPALFIVGLILTAMGIFLVIYSRRKKKDEKTEAGVTGTPGN